MGSTNPLKEQPFCFTRRLLPWILYALLPLAIIHVYFYPIPLSLYQSDQLPVNSPVLITASSFSSSSSPSFPLPSKEEESIHDRVECDYTNGKWIHDKWGPLYNDSSCGTVKEGQNCMSHGRPDKGYLYWKWEPKQCQLPRFDPKTFLHLLRNKHLAFVGDSVARNQLESLLCLLATASTPKLVYKNGEDNKFRRWHFPSHNVSVSVYWSPFLVKGIEKSSNQNYNKLFFDSVDERWASDLDRLDLIVLSVGHWFLHPAVYFDGEVVLGCHYCPGQNHTETGYYDVFGKAFKTTLDAIVDRRGGDHGRNPISVVVTTFSPAHFEGEWDKFGACSKIEPYKEGEKQLDWGDAEMRKKELKEIQEAKLNAKKYSNLRIESLDVTELSFMRPDGHPGPYMHPNPFANGIKDRVQNDCVHWCLPGPVDTWNEILLQMMKEWEGQSRKEK